jgi:hypothetical protein
MHVVLVGEHGDSGHAVQVEVERARRLETALFAGMGEQGEAKRMLQSRAWRRIMAETSRMD